MPSRATLCRNRPAGRSKLIHDNADQFFVTDLSTVSDDLAIQLNDAFIHRTPDYVVPHRARLELGALVQAYLAEFDH